MTPVWAKGVESVLHTLTVTYGPTIAAGAKGIFGIFVRQALVYGIESVFGAIVSLLVLIAIYGAWKKGLPVLKAQRENRLLFGSLAAGVSLPTAVVAIAQFIIQAQYAIQYFVNPYYYAVQMLVHMVK